LFGSSISGRANTEGRKTSLGGKRDRAKSRPLEFDRDPQGYHRGRGLQACRMARNWEKRGRVTKASSLEKGINRNGN